MRRIDKFVIAMMIIGFSLAGYAHYDAQKSCFSLKKTKTDSTPALAVSPFTGKYQRIGGVLFCVDSRGMLYPFRKIIKRK